MNRVRWNVEWRGREVENPILRPLVAFAAIAVGCLGASMAIARAAILVPASLPVHLLLRALGRKGFLTRREGSRFSYRVDLEGFRKSP
ncbi:MAG: hypothetical protein JST59_29565 [Actinobacteria bacterium]|nr:hypothetical protein [Actinomycetota bacterium]